MRTILMALLLAVTSSSTWAADVLSADAARKAALAGELTIVDIRTPQEWAQTGVPDVAHAMDMTRKGFAQRLIELYEAHPDRPMAIICASGARSTYVVTALEQRGLTRLVNIREGMSGGQHGKGWIANSLPTRRADQPLVTE